MKKYIYVFIVCLAALSSVHLFTLKNQNDAKTPQKKAEEKKDILGKLQGPFKDIVLPHLVCQCNNIKEVVSVLDAFERTSKGFQSIVEQFKTTHLFPSDLKNKKITQQALIFLFKAKNQKLSRDNVSWKTISDLIIAHEFIQEKADTNEIMSKNIEVVINNFIEQITFAKEDSPEAKRNIFNRYSGIKQIETLLKTLVRFEKTTWLETILNKMEEIINYRQRNSIWVSDHIFEGILSAILEAAKYKNLNTLRTLKTFCKKIHYEDFIRDLFGEIDDEDEENDEFVEALRLFFEV